MFALHANIDVDVTEVRRRAGTAPNWIPALQTWSFSEPMSSSAALIR
jgi:hypothetical protein